MNYSFDASQRVHSVFVAEDYFPAIIEYSSEELNNHFIEYSFQDVDMLEFAVHPITHTLKRVSLTLCNHYEIIDSPISVPECEEGAMLIVGPDTTECQKFLACVYTDGLSITLSDQPIALYRKSGNVVFAFSDNDELVSLYLVGLTSGDVFHIKTELTLL